MQDNSKEIVSAIQAEALEMQRQAQSQLEYLMDAESALHEQMQANESLRQENQKLVHKTKSLRAERKELLEEMEELREENESLRLELETSRSAYHELEAAVKEDREDEESRKKDLQESIMHVMDSVLSLISSGSISQENKSQEVQQEVQAIMTSFAEERLALHKEIEEREKHNNELAAQLQDAKNETQMQVGLLLKMQEKLKHERGRISLMEERLQSSEDESNGRYAELVKEYVKVEQELRIFKEKSAADKQASMSHVKTIETLTSTVHGMTEQVLSFKSKFLELKGKFHLLRRQLQDISLELDLFAAEQKEREEMEEEESRSNKRHLQHLMDQLEVSVSSLSLACEQAETQVNESKTESKDSKMSKENWMKFHEFQVQLCSLQARAHAAEEKLDLTRVALQKEREASRLRNMEIRKLEELRSDDESLVRSLATREAEFDETLRRAREREQMLNNKLAELNAEKRILTDKIEMEKLQMSNKLSHYEDERSSYEEETASLKEAMQKSAAQHLLLEDRLRHVELELEDMTAARWKAELLCTEYRQQAEEASERATKATQNVEQASEQIERLQEKMWVGVHALESLQEDNDELKETCQRYEEMQQQTLQRYKTTREKEFLQIASAIETMTEKLQASESIIQSCLVARSFEEERDLEDLEKELDEFVTSLQHLNVHVGDQVDKDDGGAENSPLPHLAAAQQKEQDRQQQHQKHDNQDKYHEQDQSLEWIGGSLSRMRRNLHQFVQNLVKTLLDLLRSNHSMGGLISNSTMIAHRNDDVFLFLTTIFEFWKSLLTFSLLDVNENLSETQREMSEVQQSLSEEKNEFDACMRDLSESELKIKKYKIIASQSKKKVKEISQEWEEKFAMTSKFLSSLDTKVFQLTADVAKLEDVLSMLAKKPSSQPHLPSTAPSSRRTPTLPPPPRSPSSISSSSARDKETETDGESERGGPAVPSRRRIISGVQGRREASAAGGRENGAAARDGAAAGYGSEVGGGGGGEAAAAAAPPPPWRRMKVQVPP